MNEWTAALVFVQRSQSYPPLRDSPPPQATPPFNQIFFSRRWTLTPFFSKETRLGRHSLEWTELLCCISEGIASMDFHWHQGIEIWNCDGISLPGFWKGKSLSTCFPKNPLFAAQWVGERFFCGGLAGFIYEWDLQFLKIKNTQESFGGPVMGFESQSGEEDTCCLWRRWSTLIEVTEEGLLFTRTFSKQEGRLLAQGKIRTYLLGQVIVQFEDGMFSLDKTQSPWLWKRRHHTQHSFGLLLCWAISLLWVEVLNGKHGVLQQTVSKHTADVCTGS